jgi:hypothetical protein
MGAAEPRWTDRDAVYLDFLDRRRAAAEQAMWQAPALMIAAQAFLLQVLTDTAVDWWGRVVVLIAGLVAIAAAAASLLRLRARELRFSEAFAVYSAAVGMRDVRPDKLPAASEGEGWDGRARRAGASDWLRHVYLFWVVALVAFGIADVAAFFATAWG